MILYMIVEIQKVNIFNLRFYFAFCNGIPCTMPEPKEKKHSSAVESFKNSIPQI